MRPEAKDFARIANIIVRADGRRFKEFQLTTNMAHAIKDADKAERRGRAAMSMGHDPLPENEDDARSIYTVRMAQADGFECDGCGDSRVKFTVNQWSPEGGSHLGNCCWLPGERTLR